MLIEKETAYKALKHEEEIHFQTLVSEAYGRAARIVDQMHGADAAKIARILNSIEDEISEINKFVTNDIIYYNCCTIRKELEEIRKELTVNVQKPD